MVRGRYAPVDLFALAPGLAAAFPPTWSPSPAPPPPDDPPGTRRPAAGRLGGRHHLTGPDQSPAAGVSHQELEVESDRVRPRAADPAVQGVFQAQAHRPVRALVCGQEVGHRAGVLLTDGTTAEATDPVRRRLAN